MRSDAAHDRVSRPRHRWRPAAATFPHSYKEYADTPVSCIVDRLRGATIAILNKVPMRSETLAQLPKLKFIAVAATGTDIVDKLYCRQNGITVANIWKSIFRISS